MTTSDQPNPRRKFFLLRALTQALGPDLHRRTLGVAELEALCREHGIRVPAEGSR